MKMKVGDLKKFLENLDDKDKVEFWNSSKAELEVKDISSDGVSHIIELVRVSNKLKENKTMNLKLCRDCHTMKNIKYDDRCKKCLIDRIRWEIKYNEYKGVCTFVMCACGKESHRGTTKSCNSCLIKELEELRRIKK